MDGRNMSFPLDPFWDGLIWGCELLVSGSVTSKRPQFSRFLEEVSEDASASGYLNLQLGDDQPAG